VPDLSNGLISTPRDDLTGKFSVYGQGLVSVYNTEPIPTSQAVRGGILLRGPVYIAKKSNTNLHISLLHMTSFNYFHSKEVL